MKKPAAAIGLLILLSGPAAAEDLLKPVADAFFDAVNAFFSAMQALVDIIAGFFFGLLPGLDESLAVDPMAPLTELLPWTAGLYWIFYIAVFFVVMAAIAKIWSLGKHYAVNTVVGVLLLLASIHVFGVEMKITVLKLIITALFGVPGVLFILLLHYLGIAL